MKLASNGAFKVRQNYAAALCNDEGATLDDLREAVEITEETERTARRVLGGSHPVVGEIEENLLLAREALRVRGPASARRRRRRGARAPTNAAPAAPQQAVADSTSDV
jgi:hypothetical protein